MKTRPVWGRAGDRLSKRLARARLGGGYAQPAFGSVWVCVTERPGNWSYARPMGGQQRGPGQSASRFACASAPGAETAGPRGQAAGAWVWPTPTLGGLSGPRR